MTEQHDQQIQGKVLSALKAVGGTAYLIRQAEENPKAFMALLGQVMRSGQTMEDAPNDYNLEIVINNCK